MIKRGTFKRSAAILLTLIMALGVMPFAAMAESVPDALGVNITQDAPILAVAPNYEWFTADPDAEVFILSSEADVLGFVHILNGTALEFPKFDFAGAIIRLANDIELTHELPPIYDEDKFLGIIDEQGFEIRSLYDLGMDEYIIQRREYLRGANEQDMLFADDIVHAASAAMPFSAPVAGSIAIPSGATQAQFRNLLIGNPNGNFHLTSHINLTAEWVPINNFRGTLDGQGFEIRNLFVNQSSNRMNAGLFGNIATAGTTTIRNLGLVVGNAGINAHSADNEAVVTAGGFVGTHSGGTLRIERSFVVGGNNTGSGARIYARAWTSSEGNSVFNDAMAGGMVGWNRGTLHISDSYTRVAVLAVARTGTRALGTNRGWPLAFAGGLLGLGSATINNSYVTNNVRGEARNGNNRWSYVGDLVGEGNPSGSSRFSIENILTSYNTGNRTFNTRAAVRTTAQMQGTRDSHLFGTRAHSTWGVRTTTNNNIPVLRVFHPTFFVQSLSLTAATVNAGNTHMMARTFVPSNPNDNALRWHSSNTNVATVDSITGGVVAIAPLRRGVVGTATITATANCGGHSASATITVRRAPTSVSTTADINHNIIAGQTRQLNARVEPGDVTNEAINWSSGNTGVATVNSNGLVTAHSAGVAYITAASQENAVHQVRFRITVNARPSVFIGSDINLTPVPIRVGEQLALRALNQDGMPSADTPFNWQSSNTGIATVNANGLAQGVNPGNVNITVANRYGATSPAFAIRVISASLNRSSMAMYVTETQQITANVQPADTSVSWRSDNERVATVDNQGRVTAHFPGTANIIATFAGRADFYEICVVTVRPFREAGTAADPYRINNAGDLALLRNLVNDGYTGMGEFFRLTNSIDLDNAPWQPIGNAQNMRFEGSFDGGNHVITGLRINDTYLTHAGLFGNIGASGVVNNLGISGAQIMGGRYAGGIAGFSMGRIENTWNVEGRVHSSAFHSAHAGGIAGYLAGSAQIISSFNTSEILATSNNFAYAGGLIGFAANNASPQRITVDRSFSRGNVFAHTSFPHDIGMDDLVFASAGGLIGHVSGDFEMINSYSRAFVEADAGGAGRVGRANSGVGGLIGRIENTAFGGSSSITNSYAASTLNVSTISQNLADNLEFAGGLIGHVVENHPIIIESYYLHPAAITGSRNPGTPFHLTQFGEGRTADELRVRSTFIGWDFSLVGGVWGFSGANNGFPILRGLDNEAFIDVERIELNRDEITVAVGESYRLPVFFTPSNATNRNVEWAVVEILYGEPGEIVASVSRFTGRIAGLSPGVVVISVTSSDGGHRDTVIVNVVPKVAAPQSYVSAAPHAAGLEVHLFTATPGAVIHFTTDGTIPTRYSAIYTEPIIITTHTLVRAIAIKDGYADSDMSGFLHRVLGAAPPTAMRIDTGENVPFGEPVTLPVGTLVAFGGATLGSTLRYTTDGSEPTMFSPILSGPIRVTQNMTVAVKAFSANHFDSEIVIFDFIAQVADPVFNPGDGAEIPMFSSVAILCETPDAEIWFTLDGSDPVRDAANSTRYIAPIEIDSAVTIRARAFKDGSQPSEITEATFTISDRPTISSDTIGGNVDSGSWIRLSSHDPNIRRAEIRFTTDGSIPTATSELAWQSAIGGGGISHPITIHDSVTIRAGIFNVVNGNMLSYVEDFSFTAVAAAPTANHASGGSIDLANELVLSTITEGAIIRYTTDGSAPDENSPIYTGPISIWNYFAGVEMYERITILAMAFRDGLPASSIAMFTYDVTGGRVEQPRAVALNTATDRERGIFGSAVIDGVERVVFTSSTPNAEIRFTTDGTEPTRESRLFTAPMRITENTMFTVRAFRDGMAASGTAIYTFSQGAPEPLDMSMPGLDVPITEGAPFLGGSSVELDFDNVPINVMFDGDRIKATIGVSFTPFTTQTSALRDFERIRQGLISNSLNSILGLASSQASPRGAIGDFDAEIRILGYFEGILPADDSHFELIGQIAVVFTVEGRIEKRILPVVFAGLRAGAELSIRGGLHWIPYYGTVDLNFDLGLGVALEVRGGVGIPAFASAGVYGRGRFDLDWDFVSRPDLTIRGEIGIYSQFLVFSSRIPLVGPGILWTNAQTRTNVAGASIFGVDVEMPSEFTLAPRNHLATQTAWADSGISAFGALAFTDTDNGGDFRILQGSVYSQAAPLIAEANGQRVMVFLADDGSRSSINRTILMYSIYDASTDTWNEPMPVHDDGTADFFPHIASDGNTIWLTWHNTSSELSDTATMTEMLAAAEIAIARFDGSTFVDIQILTDDYILNTLPRVAVNGNEAVVVWVQNSDNDIFGMSNTIMVSELAGGVWGAPHRLAMVSGSVVGMDIAYFGGSAHVALAINNIDNWQSNENRDLVIMDLNGYETVLASETLVSRPAFTVINGEHVLSWYQDDGIRYMTVNRNIHTLIELPTDNFRIFSNAHSTAIVYPVWEDGLGFFAARIYQDGIWGNSFMLAQTDDFAKYFDGIWDDFGTFQIVFNNSRIAIIGEDLVETNNLCVLLINPQDSANIMLTRVSFANEDVIPGYTLSMSADITNIGGVAISAVHISNGGAIIATIDLDSELRTGQHQTIEFEMLVPMTISTTDLTPFVISVEPVGIIDADMSDNSYTIRLGLPSLSLSLTRNVIDRTDEHSPIRIIAAISNTSAIPVSANLVLRRGALDGEILDVVNLGMIPGGVTITLDNFVVSPMSFVPTGESMELLFFEVVSNRQEYFAANTSGFVVIQGLQQIYAPDRHSISGVISSFNPGMSARIELQRPDGTVVDYTTTQTSTTGSALAVNSYFTFDNVTPGIYSLVVTKPGHLGFTLHNVVVSNSGVDLVSHYRPDIREFVLTPGDLNGDGFINSLDVTLLLQNFGPVTPENMHMDMNGDGFINTADRTIIQQNFGNRPIEIWLD